MLRISVIVPVYNTYRELPRCLESIINQTYKNLEIIVIDDGSTDGSQLLCDEFARKDKRIICIHQENAGESKARNRGLQEAKGDVIAFVDCDDWLDLDMYENMIKVMEQNDLDMVASSWYKSTDTESVQITNNKMVSADVIDRNMLLEYIYMRDSYRGFAYMWNKIYRRRVLEQNDGTLLRFDEQLKLGGDVLYLAKAALKCEKSRYIDKSFYHYYQREASGVHTLSCEKMKDWIKSYELTIDELVKEKISERTVSYARRFMGYHACEGVRIALEENSMKEKLFFQTIMKKCSEAYIEFNSEYPERIDKYIKTMNM